jgi:cell division protein FtsZ
VFVACGMGGGTGSGAAAVIARIAKEMGILVVGVVTKPFTFEGSRRMRIAEAGVAELGQYVDTLIVIPNQNLFRVANEKTTFADAFLRADQVLYSGIACIVDLIVKEGLINLDFADVRTVMSGMGTAMMGTGEASGERRAIQAAEEAISNPLLDDISLRGAKGLLLSIIGGHNLTLYEVDEAASRVRAEVDGEANIIVGATFDESLGDKVRVSIVASGMTRTASTGANTGAARPTAVTPPISLPTQAQVVRPAPLPQSAPVPVSEVVPAVQPTYQNQPQPAHMHPLAVPPPQPLAQPHYAQTKPATVTPQPDLARMLSDALGQGDGPDASTEVWSGPGDVRIQPGIAPGFAARSTTNTTPASGSDVAPIASPSPVATHQSFQPMPPQDAKRPTPQRMPELDEFPLVAQREYREHQARTQGGDPHSHPAAAGPRIYTPPAVSADTAVPRKPGLFERLTGKGRKDAESVDFDANRPTLSNSTQRGIGGGQINSPQPTLQVVVNDTSRGSSGRS